jgi:hypothetical protein
MAISICEGAPVVADRLQTHASNHVIGNLSSFERGLQSRVHENYYAGRSDHRLVTGTLISLGNIIGILRGLGIAGN